MSGLKRFYYDGELKGILEITGEVYNHVKNVLRYDVGSKFVLLNDREYAVVVIQKIFKRHFTVKVVEVHSQEKPEYELTVFLSVMKNRYMDFIIQKMGELSVTDVIPFYSGNSVAKVNDKTFGRYKDLLNKGALQSESNFLPEIHTPIDIYDINPCREVNILFSAREDKLTLPEVKTKSLSMIIGPEGGFTDRETTVLSNKGFDIVSPTNSVLKAETAAVVFTGMIKIFMENV